MGLFSKNTCAFCGKKLGVLNSVLASWKLADGTWLCDTCYANSCSRFACYRISSQTKEQVLEHMNETKIMRNKIATEFDVTDVITDYKDSSKVLASIDRNRRLWVVSEYKDELLSLDYISKIEVDIDYISHEDNLISRAPYTPPRADMPSPSGDRDMNTMTILIYIENHPFKVPLPIKLKICSSGPKLTQSYNSYFDEVYTYGAKCLDLFDSLMK